MLSLHRRGTIMSLNDDITAEQVRHDARVAKAKCGLGLAKGDLTRNF